MTGRELFDILEACCLDEHPYMEPLNKDFQAGVADVSYERVSLDARFDLEKAATLIAAMTGNRE